MESFSQLLIVGASTRAAAQGAVRAGLAPVCADLFLDEDLRAVAHVVPVENYPADLPAIARNLAACPWMYTGALENHPRLVAQIAAERPLLGNSAEVLARIRDPFLIYEILREADLPALSVLRSNQPPDPDTGWLLKPYRSAGGAGIDVWTKLLAEKMQPTRRQFFQEMRSGRSVSALFLAMPQETVLIGVTRQFVGLDLVHAARFAYCGSVGPVWLDTQLERCVVEIGHVLAERCGLQGLFGCDFVCDRDDVWLTEVNPRYTASVEVLEFALLCPLIDWHCRACAAVSGLVQYRPCDAEFRRSVQTTLVAARQKQGPIVAKLIVFAPADVTVPDLEAVRKVGGRVSRRAAHCEKTRLGGSLALPESGVSGSHISRFQDTDGRFAVPQIADVPTAGQVIPRGRPVCSLLATGSRIDACLATLERRRETLQACLFGA